MNETQYNLDREAAKISALSSGKLDKYVYLNRDDLGSKSGPKEQAKFEYSLLGQVLIRQLKIKKTKKTKQLKLRGLILFTIQFITFQNLKPLVILVVCHLILCRKS